MGTKNSSSAPRRVGARLNSIDALSLRLGSTLDLRKEALALLNWMGDVGLAKVAALFLIDEAKENLDVIAWRGAEPVEWGCIPVGEGLAKEVGRLFPNSFGSGGKTLWVPLVIESELIGVVCAQRPSETHLSIEESRLWDAASGIAAPILRNIQRYERLEQATVELKEHVQTEQMKDDLMYAASHDLRSPVTSIKGYAQLASKQMGNGNLDRVGQCLEVIIKQADQLSRLLDALLDVSRIQSGRLELHPEEVNIVEVIGEIVERFSGTTDLHTFRIEAPAGGVVGRWDKSRIGQAVANLVGNAVKYSPEGGEIAMRVEVSEGEAMIAVSDCGIGIPGPELDHLFEKFYRSQSALNRGLGGSGLGLYISQGVVKAHGGRIWAESGEGDGSTFFIALPIA